MVSGSKNKGDKKKQKLVLAKDKKQAVLAMVVLGLFLANSIYMVVKYFMDQIPPTPTTTAQSELKDGNAPGQGPQGSQSANPSDPNNPSNINNNAATNPAPQTPVAVPASGLNPIVPILILLLVAGAIFGIVKVLQSKTANSKDKETSNNSRVKKGAKGTKGEKKMAFAKDKKQAALALTVLGLFLLNTVYMIGKYIYEQNPPAQSASAPENSMTQQQNNNLANMNDPTNPSNKVTIPTDTSTIDPNDLTNDANDIYSQTVNLQGGKPKQPSAEESDIEIISKSAQNKRVKMTLISVADSGRSNPFLPAGENILPSSLPKFNLLAPPETAPVDSDASKVMSTTISGILYDKYSPSAIINIEGTDYLVKRGDVINHYNVLSIGKTQVLVQLGKNIYKAGVGELLTLSDMNFNTIANLNKKFGGNAVTINVKKKGY